MCVCGRGGGGGGGGSGLERDQCIFLFTSRWDYN